MRKNESQKVEKSLREIGLKLHVINAGPRFAEAHTSVLFEPTGRYRDTPILCQAVSPEDKRKIIGDVFVSVAQDFLSDMNLR